MEREGLKEKKDSRKIYCQDSVDGSVKVIVPQKRLKTINLFEKLNFLEHITHFKYFDFRFQSEILSLFHTKFNPSGSHSNLLPRVMLGIMLMLPLTILHR